MINQRLVEICAKIFGIKASEVNESITRDDMPEWDSLNHLMFLTEIEKNFGFRFTASEINTIKSIKDITYILKAKGHA